MTLGRISGLYGVKGWLKVFSHTAPRENILAYSPWFLYRDGQWEAYEIEAGRRHGKGVVARLGDLEAGEYYWTDLEGLEVVATDGTVLGIIDHLFETGANDVMVVKGDRERLVPFIRPGVVREVNFTTRRVVVDWDPDF